MHSFFHYKLFAYIQEMNLVDEELNIVSEYTIKKRLKQEIKQLINTNYIQYCFSLNKDNKNYKINNIKTYTLKFFHYETNMFYEFVIPLGYPQYPPKLILNNKPYIDYLKMDNCAFREFLYKYNYDLCFYYVSKLYSKWDFSVKMKDIIDEVNNFKQICHKVTHHVIINVIKRKYLIDDINIMEWLY